MFREYVFYDFGIDFCRSWWYIVGNDPDWKGD